MKKALTSHHSGSKSSALMESAAVTCVKLCKASTYINISDRTNVCFTLVQWVLNDLKVRFTVHTSAVGMKRNSE